MMSDLNSIVPFRSVEIGTCTDPTPRAVWFPGSNLLALANGSKWRRTGRGVAAHDSRRILVLDRRACPFAVHDDAISPSLVFNLHNLSRTWQLPEPRRLLLRVVLCSDNRGRSGGTPDVERPHGQLGSGLADGLGGDNADGSRQRSTIAWSSQVTAVARLAHRPACDGTGQDGPNPTLLDTGTPESSTAISC